jgi:hypothetical protein
MHDHPLDGLHNIPPDARMILDELSIEVTIPYAMRASADHDVLLQAITREVEAWLPALQRAIHLHHPHVEVQVSPLTR